MDEERWKSIVDGLHTRNEHGDIMCRSVFGVVKVGIEEWTSMLRDLIISKRYSMFWESPTKRRRHSDVSTDAEGRLVVRTLYGTLLVGSPEHAGYLAERR